MNQHAVITEEESERMFGNSNKGQALMLLGRGTSAQSTAAILGVSPSLISQFMEDDDFVTELTELKCERELAASIRDEAKDNLEDKAIAKVEAVIDYITKPMEAVALLKTINGLNRTATPNTGLGDKGTGVISVVLPKGIIAAKVNIEVNAQNQVIEVEGRGMQTMDQNTLLQELNEFKGSKEIDNLLDSLEVREIVGEIVTEPTAREVISDDTRSEVSTLQASGGNEE